MRAEVIESVLMVAVVLIIRSVLLTVYLRRHPDLNIGDKRRPLVSSHNLTLILVLLGLAMIWAAQIQTLVLSMFAVTVAVVVAAKELIMCLSGSILRSVAEQYSAGDYIEASGLREQVVDISLLNTLMMQIGLHPLADQLSDKTLSLPNSLSLSYHARRDNILGLYMIHTVEIPVPIHLDSDAVIPNLKQILELLCASYAPEISCYFDAVQTEKLFITPAAQSRATHVPHDNKVYNIIVHYAPSVSKWLETQQVVLDGSLCI